MKMATQTGIIAPTRHTNTKDEEYFTLVFLRAPLRGLPRGALRSVHPNDAGAASYLKPLDWRSTIY